MTTEEDLKKLPSRYEQGYAAGYNDGFRAGLEMGKGPKAPSPLPWSNPAVNAIGHSCKVCGMFFEIGKAYGYVCGNPSCPTRITC